MTLIGTGLLGRLAAVLLMVAALSAVSVASGSAVVSAAQPAAEAAARTTGGGEANLVLPDLSTVDFHGINGRSLLMGGLVVCALGLAFGLFVFTQLKNLPV